MNDGEIVILSVGISVAIGLIVVAVGRWWKGVEARYDATFVEPFAGRVVEEGSASVTVSGFILIDDPVVDTELDEKALRRMMKETSEKMDWTQVKWR